MAVSVIMPKLEMSQETATVVQWLKKEGDTVRQGEPLLIVQTDKVEVEVEAPASGVLAAIAAAPGQEVPVTTVIAQLLQSEETTGRQTAVRATQRLIPVARRLAQEHGLDLAQISGSGPGGRIGRADVEAALHLRSRPGGTAPQRVRATPAARRAARETGLDIAAIAGTGPRGRVQEADVRAVSRTTLPPFASNTEEAGLFRPETPPKYASGEAGSQTLQPFTGIRAIIAERMTASYRTAPHIHLSVTADGTGAEEARRRWKALCGEKISLTVLLVKACAWALRRHPAVNATVDAAGIRRHAEVNVGVAVALPEGLIVPVLHKADTRPIGELARALADLAERARQGKLRPNEVTDGTFTLSNLGMFGIEAFDPLLNPPQVAALGVGAVMEMPVALEGAIVIRPRMTLTLAADHRALDGADAARFLQDIRRAIEEPSLMLL